jgi:hypothetical protein
MSASSKPAKKQHPLPQRADFKTWKDSLDQSLKSGSPERQALDRWLEAQAEFYRSLGETERAHRDSLFEVAYLMTRPQLGSDAEKRKHQFVATKLKELLPVVESTLGTIKACGSGVLPEDGTPAIHLSDLSGSLEDSAFYIQEALKFLARPYGRSADVLGHCLVLLLQLKEDQVPERNALALTRLLMRAHGFPNDELDVFSLKTHETGTARKRRRDILGKYFHMIESNLDSRRIHKKEPPFNPALYKQKED